MGVFMDLIHEVSDMHKLSKMTDTIEGEINNLQAAGKLPDELKTAFENLKNTKTVEGGTAEDAVKPLQEFGTVLEKYENLFPENVQAIVTKFQEVTKDVEGIAGNFDNLGKK